MTWPYKAVNTLEFLFKSQMFRFSFQCTVSLTAFFPFTVVRHEEWVRAQPATFSKKSLFALFVPCEMNVFVSACLELMFYAPSAGHEALISQLPRDQLTPHFLPRASYGDHSGCVSESLLYLLWSRLSLQQSGSLIASIHYSARLQLHHTPKQHRNKTRLRLAWNVSQRIKWWRRWGGGLGDWGGMSLYLHAIFY